MCEKNHEYATLHNNVHFPIKKFDLVFKAESFVELELKLENKARNSKKRQIARAQFVQKIR